mgnify:CR=1 FL=1
MFKSSNAIRKSIYTIMMDKDNAKRRAWRCIALLIKLQTHYWVDTWGERQIPRKGYGIDKQDKTETYSTKERKG